MFEGRLLPLLLLVAVVPSVFAQAPIAVTPIEAGLYMSPVMDLSSVPDVEDLPHHLFLKVAADQRASLMISPRTPQEVDGDFSKHRDETGVGYKIVGESIEFNFGPTRHMVSVLSAGKVLLVSEYKSGITSKTELAKVLPSTP
jgi:hypothetical protein